MASRPSPQPSPSGIHISDSPRAILPSKGVKVRQTKSELGAVRGPHAGCPRGDPGPLPVLILCSSVEGFERHLHLRSTGVGPPETYYVSTESQLQVRQLCDYPPKGIHISDSPRAILPSKSVKVRQTKSELGAVRGPHAGTPRGVVVATSPRLNLKRVAVVLNQNKYFPLLDCLAGRYRSQF